VILTLAEAPGAIPALAALMEAEWPDWYGPGGRGAALADLRGRTRTEGLPLGFVAREGQTVLGGAALAATSYGAEPGETPWIVGLLVAPEARGRGTGSALVAACEARARAAGASAIFATTGTARGLLQRRGWSVLRNLGEGQTVLRLPL
jgi:predicted N-acetyltransferase YhbS